MKKQKLYCYVDETGQDTGGDFFLVSTVILDAEQRDKAQRRLLEIERKSEKFEQKWTRATHDNRVAYIRGVLKDPALTGKLYYSVYRKTRAYVELTMSSVAQAIHACVSSLNNNPYIASVLVDGLQRPEKYRFALGLRKLGVRARRVSGADNESDVFIRLADALAGFVRDARSGDDKLRPLYMKALRKEIIHEI